jgi:hypothetical protein
MGENQVDKKLTREEQIEAYQKEHDRRMKNVEEFKHQLYKLKLSLLVMDKEKSKQVDTVLDSLPDTSAKGIADKILQIPMEKRTQLNENIKKMELAIENETRRAGEYAAKKKAIETAIFNERLDEKARSVVGKFERWIGSYKECLDYFNSELAPTIQEGYDLAPDFYRRIELLGLDKSIQVSIESHFRQGERVYMADCLEKIQNLSDSYGPPLLEKDFQGSWPADSNATFFSEL